MSQGCNSSTEFAVGGRHVSYGYGTKCDNTLSTGWYRFIGNAGSYMPESCPGVINICGTSHPGWLNGIHPTVAEGVVTRTACFVSSATTCCNWKSTIEVQNCGNFYVYKLVPSPTCNLRYCGTNVGKYFFTFQMWKNSKMTKMSTWAWSNIYFLPFSIYRHLTRELCHYF